MDYACIECGAKPMGVNSDECGTCEAYLFWDSYYAAMRIEAEAKPSK